MFDLVSSPRCRAFYICPIAKHSRRTGFSHEKHETSVSHKTWYKAYRMKHDTRHIAWNMIQGLSHEKHENRLIAKMPWNHPKHANFSNSSFQLSYVPALCHHEKLCKLIIQHTPIRYWRLHYWMVSIDSPKYLTKWPNFVASSAFVRPSAGWSLVGI